MIARFGFDARIFFRNRVSFNSPSVLPTRSTTSSSRSHFDLGASLDSIPSETNFPAGLSLVISVFRISNLALFPLPFLSLDLDLDLETDRFLGLIDLDLDLDLESALLTEFDLDFDLPLPPLFLLSLFSNFGVRDGDLLLRGLAFLPSSEEAENDRFLLLGGELERDLDLDRFTGDLDRE